jgi:Icc-related predicted phosphoesterase
MSFGHWSIGYYLGIGAWNLVIQMKCIYTSDLHGEIYLYQELLELAQSSSAEIIALGGDLFPSIPPTKRYQDMIPNQKTFIDQFLLPFFKRTMETTDVKYLFLIPGNWDIAYPHLFKQPIDGIIDLDRKICLLKNGYEIIGYPFVPPTPFRPKDYEKMDDDQSAWPPQKNPSYIRGSKQDDEITAIDPYLYLRGRETIQEDLDLLPKPVSQKKAIYLTHSPPFGTQLDRIEGGKSAGSRALKAFIESNQPLLNLTGHIHESPQISRSYFEWIGETLAINPGQLISRRLHAVTFEIERLKETLKHTYLPDITGHFNF